jgi:hypothetical protein
VSTTWTITEPDADGLVVGGGGGVAFVVEEGVPGPNTVSDSTAVGTLTSAAADAASLLSTNAAGNAVRRIPLTTFSRSLLGLADAAAGRTALGLGTAAVLDASNVPLLNAVNQFSLTQKFNAGLWVGGAYGNDGNGRSIDIGGYSVAVSLGSTTNILWEPHVDIRGEPDTRIGRTAAGSIRLSRLGTNGESSVLSFAGPSSAGTIHDVAVLTTSYATAADASFQGQVDIGVRGIIGGNEVAQNPLRIVGSSTGGRTEVRNHAGTLLFQSPYFGESNFSWFPQNVLFSQLLELAAGGSLRSTYSGNTVTIDPSGAHTGSTAEFVAASASLAPLTLRGASGQTADLLRLQGSSGSNQLRVGPDGVIHGLNSVKLQLGQAGANAQIIGGALEVFGNGRFIGIGAFGDSPTVGIQLLSTASAASVVPLRLQNAASQTADTLQLWGVSSTSTNRAQAAVNSSWETDADASRQGKFTVGVYGIVGASETLQTGMTMRATSSGRAIIGIGRNPTTAPFEIQTDANGDIQRWYGTGATFICQQGGVQSTFVAYDSTVPLYFGTSGPGTTAAGSAVHIQASSQDVIVIRYESSTTRIGFHGATPVAKPTFAADATDLATALTLVNDLKARLVAYGLGA